MSKLAQSVWLILCATLLAVPAVAAEYAPALAYSGNADYRLGSGDKVKVTVFGEADLGGDFQVDATGFVRMPMIGQVKAGLDGARRRNQHPHRAGTATSTTRASPWRSPTYRPFYIVGQVRSRRVPLRQRLTEAAPRSPSLGFHAEGADSIVYVRHPGDNGASSRRRCAPIAGDDRVDSTVFWDVIDVLGPLAGISALRYAIVQ